MAYDQSLASPSQEAHDAAAALDKVYDALADGAGVDDIGALMSIRPAASYLFEAGISKGEAISRAIQVLSLLERDNALLAGVIGLNGD